MVSYIQVEGYGLEQGFKGVEKPASGRPKPTHGIEEDADYYYTYTRTGGVSKYTKTDLDKYWDFLENHVIFKTKGSRRFSGIGKMLQMPLETEAENPVTRVTPATDYEISMGYGAFNPYTIFQPTSPIYNPSWQSTMRHGNFTSSFKDMARTPLKNLADEHFRKLQEAEDKARKLAEEQRLAKLREARPNPKEVEKVEPVEVEPIKQIVKYSPLMIAGVIAVVVILLLKRRRV